MEWFGLTVFGFPDPIKYMMRKDYKEPTELLSVEERIARGSKQTLAEMISELDLYLGISDGNAYKSNERLIKMRKKGVMKPVGPSDMYRYALTDAQNFSFWMDDPEIKKSNWYVKTVFKPKCTGDLHPALS